MPSRQKKTLEYWQRTAMVSRRATLLREMKIGNVEAAKKLLATSLGALARAINREAIDDADVVILDYVRTAIQGIMDGQSMELALGVEKKQGGRPRRSNHDDLTICDMVKMEAETLKKNGTNAPIRTAQEFVARKMNMDPRAVRSIWNKKKFITPTEYLRQMP